MRRRPSPPGVAATSVPVCRADKAMRPLEAAGSATFCVAHWADFLAARRLVRWSMAGSAACSSNYNRAARAMPAHSWVGTGPNKTISQGELANALGSDTLDKLSQQTGMERGDLLSGLSQYLPNFVDRLTPQGRVPTHEEAERMA